jgi:hypothetical protein
LTGSARFARPLVGRIALLMTTFSAEELLRRPIDVNGIALGHVTDLIVDLDGRGDASNPSALGFDVVCRDGVHRFLPFGAAVIGADAITIQSPLLLLEEAELAFYRSRGATLRSLRGSPVGQSGAAVGLLADFEVARDGALAAVVADDRGRRVRVPFDADVRIGRTSRRAPAA